MNSQAIVIFSSDDWGWKTSKYQLSIRFAHANKVLFVSSIGFRSPTVCKHDIVRILRKLAQSFSGVKKIDEDLFVLTPLVIPCTTSAVAKINRFLLKVQVMWACVKLRIHNPYHFVFSQNWYPLIKSLRCKKLVYYCVDDQSSFSGVNVEQFVKYDGLFAKEADFVFCSSRQLFEQKNKISRECHYLPHGVNYELFSKAVFDASLTVPADTASLRGPVLGFFGHISYDWVDVDLLKFISMKKPMWTLLLLGRYSMKVDEFADYPNIVYLGEKAYDQLPSYCKAMHVGLIPFVHSKLTANCNPLKLYEYLAAGLPVISTDIPEVRYYSEKSGVATDCYVASTYEQFLECCITAINGITPEAKLKGSYRVKCHSWDARVKKIYDVLGFY